jgi:hypothetical protein
MILMHQPQDLTLFGLSESFVLPQVFICCKALLIGVLEIKRSAFDDPFNERKVHTVNELVSDGLSSLRGIVQVKVNLLTRKKDVDGSLIADCQCQFEGQPSIKRTIVDVDQLSELIEQVMKKLVLIVKDGHVEQGIACFRRVHIEDGPNNGP